MVSSRLLSSTLRPISSRASELTVASAFRSLRYLRRTSRAHCFCSSEKEVDQGRSAWCKSRTSGGLVRQSMVTSALSFPPFQLVYVVSCEDESPKASASASSSSRRNGKGVVRPEDEDEDEEEEDDEDGANKDDPDEGSTCYLAYHNWEHWSSVRNINGPHTGPPKVREVCLVILRRGHVSSRSRPRLICSFSFLPQRFHEPQHPDHPLHPLPLLRRSPPPTPPQPKPSS